MDKDHKNYRYLIYLIILFAVVSIFYLPVLDVKLYSHTKQEFGSHAEFADLMLSDFQSVPKFIIAHPLYAFSEVGLMWILKITSRNAGMITSLLAYLFLAWIIFKEIRKIFQGKKEADLLAFVATITAMIASHIPVLLLVDREMYFGYIGINAYNNATSNFLKPFALSAFLFIIKSFDSERPVTKCQVFISAFLIITSTLIKPSFVICILPAVIFLSAIRSRRHQVVHWKMVLGGLVIPAAITLGWQYLINYGEGTSKIIFYPLGVKEYYSDELILKFIFSILFPLLVTRAYFPHINKDPRMALAWISFLIGAFYAYFLAEDSGGGLLHGNFDWSSEITLFILFVVSLLFFLQEKVTHPNISNWDKVIVLSMTIHLVSGIFFYLFNLRIDSYSFLPSIRRIFEGNIY